MREACEVDANVDFEDVSFTLTEPTELEPISDDSRKAYATISSINLTHPGQCMTKLRDVGDTMYAFNKVRLSLGLIAYGSAREEAARRDSVRQRSFGEEQIEEPIKGFSSLPSRTRRSLCQKSCTMDANMIKC